jgi:hypothetical protein
VFIDGSVNFIDTAVFEAKLVLTRGKENLGFLFNFYQLDIWLQTWISVGKLIRTSCFVVGLIASRVLFNRNPRSSRNSELLLLKIVRGRYS